jgi:DNA invertase Pin-like site-specific DNA recombinase
VERHRAGEGKEQNVVSQGKRRPVAVGRSAWSEAAVLFLVPAAVGVAVRMLGGPTWLTLSYEALGIVLAVARLGYASSPASRRVAPLPGPPPAALPGNTTMRTESAAPDTAAPPRERRAVGYVCVTRDGGSSELAAYSEVIRAWAAENGVNLTSITHDTATPAESVSPDAAAPPRERRALGYVRVTRDGGSSELAAHSDVIRAWAAENGVTLTSIVHDVEVQTGDGGARPALRGALERIAAREADTLVTARLEHLSPTVANLPPLLRWLSASSRTLVAIDLRLDSATEAGRLAASALADIGGWEHERLSARTRRGLQAARARGSGAGPASVADVPELKERIKHMREQGMTLQAIADSLNEEGVPTLRGGAKWRPSSVQRAAGYLRPPSQQPSIDLPGSSQAGEDEPAPPS